MSPSAHSPSLAVVLPLSLLVFLQLQMCELRLISSSCERKYGRCHGHNKQWQHDGVCWERGVCYAPDETEFSLTVTAKLRTLNKNTEAGKAIKSLWMRGTGAGLSWDKPVELRRVGSSIDSWRTELKYRSSSDALLCTSADFCSMNQRALEFRLYRDQMGKDDMMGPNFYAKLPISHSMKGSANSLTPSMTVYPWFDGKDVVGREVAIKSSLHVTGKAGELKTTIDILYPPSFNYNSRKMYPLVLVVGYDIVTIAPLLEHMYIHEASTQEAVVVGIRPYEQTAPYALLSPYPNSYVWQCKEKDCYVNCQTCWILKKDEPCEKEDFIEQAERCLYPQLVASRGEQVLDMIELDLLPMLREMNQQRLLLEFPKHRISLVGLDGAGLLACYAAITRPHVYRNAGCLSAPFYWPLNSSLTNPAPSPGILQTLQDLEKDFHGNPALLLPYLSQRYYIDMAENEHEVLPLVDAQVFTDKVIQQLQDTLKLEEENLVYFTFPGAYSYPHHKTGSLQIFQRIQYALRMFLRAEGGPSREGARTQPVLDKTLAEQNELYGHLLATQHNESTLQSCDAHHTMSKPTEVPIIFFIPTLGKEDIHSFPVCSQ